MTAGLEQLPQWAEILKGVTEGVNAVTGVAKSIYDVTQDAPEPAKPNLPTPSSPTSIQASGPMGSGAPFMGRQNTDEDKRQSTAMALLSNR